MKDILEKINVTYANDMSVLINGFSKNGITFNIEVSYSSSIKTRNISVYCADDVYRWFSEDPLSHTLLLLPSLLHSVLGDFS